MNKQRKDAGYVAASPESERFDVDPICDTIEDARAAWAKTELTPCVVARIRRWTPEAVAEHLPDAAWILDQWRDTICENEGSQDAASDCFMSADFERDFEAAVRTAFADLLRKHCVEINLWDCEVVWRPSAAEEEAKA